MVHTESFFPNPGCLSARLLFTFSTLSAPIPVDQGGIHHMNMFSRLVLTQILSPQASVPRSLQPRPPPTLGKWGAVCQRKSVLRRCMPQFPSGN